MSALPHNDMSEQWSSWMRAAQAGDKAAYVQLLQALTPWLKRYLRSKVHANDVDDVVQEVLLSIHRYRHTYDGRSPFIPWLVAIAHHRWVDYVRKVAPRNEDEFDEAVHDLAITDGAEARDDAQQLEYWLAQIPVAQAEALRLIKINGFSGAEAASKMQRTEESVKVLVHRGMKKLLALTAQETSR